MIKQLRIFRAKWDKCMLVFDYDKTDFFAKYM